MFGYPTYEKSQGQTESGTPLYTFGLDKSDFGGDAMGGALVGGLFGLAGAGISQHMASKAAAAHRRWQFNMDSTKYQRTMWDLERAGLNPLLVGKFGASGPPSGAVAKTPDYGQAVSSALASMRLREDLKNLRSTRQLQERQGLAALATAGAQEAAASLADSRRAREDTLRLLDALRVPQAQAQANVYTNVPELSYAKEGGSIFGALLRGFLRKGR